MENIEILILICIAVVIIFLLLRILKYALILGVVVYGLYAFGVIDNKIIEDLDKEYSVSETLNKWNEKLGLKGIISGEKEPKILDKK